LFANKFREALKVLSSRGELKAILQHYLGAKVNVEPYLL